MAKFGGRRVSIGVGKETTRGTSVAASYWDRQADLKIDDRTEYVKDESSFGTIEDSENSHLIAKWSEGEITAKLKDKTFGLWLLSLMGSVADATVETGVYDHTFTVGNSNQHQALTISVDDPIQDYRYANSVVTSLEISAEIGKMVDYKIGFMGKAGATATNTPSFVAENYFLPQHGTFKQASDISGLSGASATTIKKFSIKVEKNVERDMVLGSVAPADFLNKQFSVSGEVELYFENESDWKTYQLADTARAMQLVIANTAVTIGAASNPTLTIEVAKAKFTNLDRDLSINGIVSQKVSFTGHYDLSNTRMLRFIYRDTVATF